MASSRLLVKDALFFIGVAGPALLSSALSIWTMHVFLLREALSVHLAAIHFQGKSKHFRKKRSQSENISVATPAEPRGEKKTFFVQILGGEKLLKFVEKCR